MATEKNEVEQLERVTHFGGVSIRVTITSHESEPSSLIATTVTKGHRAREREVLAGLVVIS